jgi:hypothetical protein
MAVIIIADPSVTPSSLLLGDPLLHSCPDTSWYAKTCHDTAQNITASQAAVHRAVPHQTPIDDEVE